MTRSRLSLACVLATAMWAQSGDFYNQPYRPQYHFSPLKNWTNDPNGLVYLEGEYHLFFQYNPFADTWGHMSWGHAVSRDMLHWKELPVALPEENGIMIFTGSTVVDDRNTSGLCRNGRPCMVAIYTGHTPKTSTKPALQTQNLAFSNDRGRTWTKYSQNPVLNLNRSNFRDPDVFWSDQGKRWVMVVSLPDDHQVLFYGSPDLKRWERMSEFGPAGAVSGQWECPNLFQLPLDGNARDMRWVLKVGLNPGSLQGGSGEQYFVGRFDGTRFRNDNAAPLALWSDYGKDCYCALTFNALPPQAKPVMIGWMNNWQYAGKVPTSPWRGQMTIPRELALKTFPEGIRLTQAPSAAITKLHDQHIVWTGKELKVPGHSFQVASAVQFGRANEAGWKLLARDGSYTSVGYNVSRRELFVDRTHSGLVSFSRDFPARTAAPLALTKGRLRLEILVDRNSVEVFADGGHVTLTNLVFPEPDAFRLEFYSDRAPESVKADVWTLRSTW